MSTYSLQVAEDFIDISTPLKHLSEASIVPLGKSLAPPTGLWLCLGIKPIWTKIRKSGILINSIFPIGTPGRDQNFAEKSRNFEGHAGKLADTAKMVATAGGCRNKKTVEEIFKTSAQVRTLSLL